MKTGIVCIGKLADESLFESIAAPCAGSGKGVKS